MTISLKLDAKALRALIADSDPSFKLELQQAVACELVRKTLMKDAAPIAEHLVPDAVAAVIRDDQMCRAFADEAAKAIRGLLRYDHSYGSRKSVTLTPETARDIKSAVETATADHLSGVTDAAAARIKERADEHLAAVEGMVDRKLKAIMEAYFQRDVQAEVTRRLQAAAAG